MRTALIIKRETGFVSNETGQLVNITSEQAMIDQFYDDDNRKYSFIELYTKLGQLKAKTLRQLNEDAWKFAEINKLGYDFELFITK